MTGAVWRSATVAALFAVHPLHVESVAWESERKDVVSALFLLITIWLYHSWTRDRSKLTYALMCVAFMRSRSARASSTPSRRTAAISGRRFSGVAIVFRNTHRYLFTGWFWFAGTLVPVIGIVQIGGQAMADRYAYIPHIGLFIAIVWSVAEFATRHRMKEVAAAVATIAIAIAILAFLCYRQTAFWKDSATLFAHSLQVTTNNYIAHEHLAAAQKEKAQFEESLVNYRAAYRIKSDSPQAREGLTHALIDLAKLDRARGRDSEAMKALDEAQAIGGQDEKTRAAIALAKNDVNTAIELYRKRLRESAAPDDAAKAHNDLGAALASAGKDEEAVAEYRKSLELDPMRYDAHMNLGALLSRMDRNTEAIKEFQAAASIQPKSIEPLVYAALAYQLMNRWSDALSAATRAYQADPKASNAKLTTALRMAYKETNFEEWLAFLESKTKPGS